MATAAGSSRNLSDQILLHFIWVLISSSFPSQQFFLLSIFCRFFSLFLSFPLTCFLNLPPASFLFHSSDLPVFLSNRFLSNFLLSSRSLLPLYDSSCLWFPDGPEGVCRLSLTFLQQSRTPPGPRPPAVPPAVLSDKSQAAAATRRLFLEFYLLWSKNKSQNRNHKPLKLLLSRPLTSRRTESEDFC